MNKADLKRNLKAELLKIERQNRTWSTGETRYDRMIEDVLRYVDNSISKEVIENKLNYWNNRLKEDERLSWMLRDKAIINVLQELLEEK